MPTTKHKPHELDVLIVANVDTDCDVIDTEYNYPHKDYFQVLWSGHPHRVTPGGTKRMPRFLAEHYAKHLANHVLMKMEEATGRKGLVQSSFERPRVLSQILKGVDTWFLGDTEVEEGEKVASMVDELNPAEKPLDLGDIPNPAVGVLKPEPKPVVIEEDKEPEPKPSDQKTSIFDDSKPKPTKKELIADCEKLGIDVTGKETVDQLIEKIKTF